MSNPVTNTQICKVNGEYIVKAFGIDCQGNLRRITGADYYTGDKTDAIETARAMRAPVAKAMIPLYAVEYAAQFYVVLCTPDVVSLNTGYFALQSGAVVGIMAFQSGQMI